MSQAERSAGEIPFRAVRSLSHSRKLRNPVKLVTQSPKERTVGRLRPLSEMNDNPERGNDEESRCPEVAEFLSSKRSETLWSLP